MSFRKKTEEGDLSDALSIARDRQKSTTKIVEIGAMLILLRNVISREG